MKDQISALIDSELSFEDYEHVYTALKADGEATRTWDTYHLIGDVMRGNPVFSADFNSRLMDKLDAEPLVLVASAKSAMLHKSKENKAVWSVAASVAAVMFVGWMVLNHQVADKASVAPAEVAQNVPAEYLAVHQSYAPSNAAYYIQPASYSESAK
jgi:sigma-E factor negative regulatory protein RseA